MNDIPTAPVSAIIPCWRAGVTIRRALESIAAQTLRPAEVILVDDASGDDTLVILQALVSEYPAGWITVISLEKNQGPGVARNAGWERATQPWLAFLDADDAWHPRKIEMQYGLVLRRPDTTLCGHGTAIVEDDEVYPEVAAEPRTWGVSFWVMLVANRFPTRSVMLKRELPFRFEGKHVTEDYLLWLQVLLSGYKCYRMDVSLAASFRPDSSPGGYSGQLWRHEKRELAAWRVLHKQELIGCITLIAALAWSVIKYVRRVALVSFNQRMK
jgi:teichuronic acid biosynthesis glycosyltransferase TuaG